MLRQAGLTIEGGLIWLLSASFSLLTADQNGHLLASFPQDSGLTHVSRSLRR